MPFPHLILKNQLFLLAVSVLAVVALASDGVAEILYFDDFEDYDKGYDILNEAHWGPWAGAISRVEVGVSMPEEDGNPGKQSLVLGEAVGDKCLFFWYNKPAVIDLSTAKVVGCWWQLMTPTDAPDDPARIWGYLANRTLDIHFGINASENAPFNGYPPGAEQVTSEMNAEPDAWYRVMYVEEGNKLDLYVQKAGEKKAKEENLGTCKQTPKIRDYECLMIRRNNRVDNVVIAESMDDINYLPPPLGYGSVDSAGKLATTWARIKAE
jgi:hypothetical protein